MAEDKIKHAARNKVWYEENKEKRNVVSKIYYQNNKEKQLVLSRAWYQRNKAKCRVAGKAWQERNPTKIDNYRLLRQYGITLDEYNAMHISQGGLCAICNTQPKKLCVDHDHATGRVRKLLCHKCNLAVAWIEQGTGMMDKANKYIREHSI